MQEFEIEVAPNTRPVGKFLTDVATKRQVEITNKISTEELAAALRVVPQTVRAGLCRKGHYLGLRPVKLPNAKLLWDVREVARLLSGEGV